MISGTDHRVLGSASPGNAAGPRGVAGGALWNIEEAIGGADLRSERGAFAPVLVVIAALFFNSVLCVVNAHLFAQSMMSVAAVELMLVVLAFALALRGHDRQALAWYGLIYFLLMFACLRGAVTGQFEAKFVRDVILIPAFVLLGMTMPAQKLPRLIVLLHVIVIAGALFEALWTKGFSSFFEVRDYYIATRGFAESAFWDKSSNLFISATRPEDRFFSFVDLHRVSSLFLEPVTLGNYVIVVTIFICAYFGHLSPLERAFLIVGNVFLLVCCDGRLATVSALIIVGVSLVVRWMPRYSALAYLPAAIIAVIAFTTLYSPDPRVDNFSGRLAFGMDLLKSYDVWQWLGMSNDRLSAALDSGIAYMILTQSVFGVILFWCVFVLSARERAIEQRIYLHGAAIFIALTMLVSYSLFSIKTAALLWFIHGSLQASGALRAAAGEQIAVPRKARRRSLKRPGRQGPVAT